jgi:hypothetical protein
MFNRDQGAADPMSRLDRTGPCSSCGALDAPYVGNGEDGPEYFCCACNLDVMGEVDPNCDCGVCAGERRRVLTETFGCQCEQCTAEWRRLTRQ